MDVMWFHFYGHDNSIQWNLYNEPREVALKTQILSFAWHSLYKIVFILPLMEDHPPVLRDHKI